jgi:putative transposase
MRAPLPMVPHEQLWFRHDIWTIVVKPRDDELVLRRVSDSHEVTLSLYELMSDPSYGRVDIAAPERELPGLPPEGLWDLVPETEKERACEREAIVLEIETGHRVLMPEPGARPRPEFDPEACRLLKDRIVDMCHILREANSPYAVTPRQIERWLRAYYGGRGHEGQGVWGLVDKKRVKFSNIFARLDSRWLDTFRSLIADQALRSTHEKEWFRVEVHARVEERYGRGVVREPGKSWFYAIWDRITAISPTGTTQSRVTAVRSREPAENRTSALRPLGTQVLDACRIDLFVIDDATGKLVRPEMGASVDEYSHCVLAGRFDRQNVDGVDAALLLYDALRPKLAPAGLPPEAYMVYGGCPGLMTIPYDGDSPELLANQPFGLGDASLIDHGKIFLSHNFQQISSILGMDVRWAPPLNPAFKGAIERFFSTQNSALWSRFRGYTGRNTVHRGHEVGKTPIFDLLLSELRQAWWQWTIIDYHNTPTDGCRLEGTPQVRVSPKVKLQEGMERCGFVTAPPDSAISLRLLNNEWRVINRPEIDVHNLKYWSPVLDIWAGNRGLARLREHPYPPLPGRVPKNRFLFKVDPHDVRQIWFVNPIGGTLHPVTCRFLEDVPLPLSRGLLRFCYQLALGMYGRVDPERLAWLARDVLDRFQRGLPRSKEEADAVRISIVDGQRSCLSLPDKSDGPWLTFAAGHGEPEVVLDDAGGNRIDDDAKPGRILARL